MVIKYKGMLLNVSDNLVNQYLKLGAVEVEAKKPIKAIPKPRKKSTKSKK